MGFPHSCLANHYYLNTSSWNKGYVFTTFFDLTFKYSSNYAQDIFCHISTGKARHLTVSVIQKKKMAYRKSEKFLYAT